MDIKIKPLILCAGAFLGASLSGQHDDPDAVTWIPGTATPPAIDGQIDQIWHAQSSMPITVLTNGSVENEDDFSAVWYGLYDDTFYYILVDIRDQILESEAGSAGWRNDRIETYFNMDNVKPGGNGHNGDNFQYNFRWNRPEEESVNNNTWAGVVWAYSTTDYGYITEIRIPWNNMTGTPPEAGFSFGFDIAIIDNDGSADYDSITYWWNSTGQAEYSNIDGAGTIGLGALFDGNYAPVLEPVEVQVALENESVSFPLAATDANPGDRISFGSGDLPAFASLQDNEDGTGSILIEATPGDANIYEFSVSASDGLRSDSTGVILIVKDPDIPFQVPVIAPLTDLSVQQGSQSTIEVQVTDIDSLSVSLSGIDLPSFATLTDAGDKSATLVLQPDFSIVPQQYAITLHAEDSDNQSDSITFNVDITEAPHQTEFYCDPESGSMDNNGSADNPWSALQAVFEAGKQFQAGDVIYLLSGYHGEPVISGNHSDYVTITAAQGAFPFLSRLLFSNDSSYWEVNNIEVSRSYAQPFTPARMVEVFGDHNTLRDAFIFTEKDSSSWSLSDWRGKVSRGIFIGGSHNLLENCTFLNVGYGIHVVGSFNKVIGNTVQNFSADGMLGLGNDLLFENNYVADNYNIDDNHDDGFQSWSTGSDGPGSGVVQRNTLRGNTIIQTTDPDRPFQGSLQGIGCFGGMYEDWVIENNVVVVNHSHGITLYGGINCRLVNNTVVDLDLDASPGPTWLYISTHKNYGSAPTPEEKEYYKGWGNVVKNNLVTSLAASDQLATVENNIVLNKEDLDTCFVAYPFDLHLKKGSPAIDNGTGLDASTIDADGQVRPVDGDADGTPAIDVGAFEYNEWRNTPIHHAAYADMGDPHGWFYIAEDPWILVLNLSKWIYLSPSWTGTSGGWAWLPK